MAIEAVQLLPQAPGELLNAIRNIESIPALADMIASFMDLKAADKQEILATFDLKARLDRVLTLLGRRIEVLKVSRQIDEKTREAFDDRQKEAVLRERLHQIQKELGESDGSKSELADLKKSIKDAGMPQEVEEQAQRELHRLERMPEQARRILDDPDLFGVAARHALGETRSGAGRYRTGSKNTRRRSLRPRQDQAPDSRIPGRP